MAQSLKCGFENLKLRFLAAALSSSIVLLVAGLRVGREEMESSERVVDGE